MQRRGGGGTARRYLGGPSRRPHNLPPILCCTAPQSQQLAEPPAAVEAVEETEDSPMEGALDAGNGDAISGAGAADSAYGGGVRSPPTLEPMCSQLAPAVHDAGSCSSCCASSWNVQLLQCAGER